MLQSDNQGKKLARLKLIGGCLISCILVFLTHFALSLVPRFFYTSSLLYQFALSAMVLLVVVGFGGRFRRLVGVPASAPAFVFVNILFVWGVYVAVVRPATSRLMDILFNGEVAMLIIGLCSILSSDPGLVTHGSSCSNKSSGSEVEANDEGLESSTSGICHESPTGNPLSLRRLRYCSRCKAYIKGFDHHCPAFGNCIGQNNHVLFMLLLVGFLISETFYIMCSSQFAAKLQILDRARLETTLAGNLAISTMLFSFLQVLWQGVFLTWHIYCVCFNIRTDEWINWKMYPEFQLHDQSHPGQSFTKMRFRNPYDKGILQNVKEFMAING